MACPLNAVRQHISVRAVALLTTTASRLTREIPTLIGCETYTAVPTIVVLLTVKLQTCEEPNDTLTRSLSLWERVCTTVSTPFPIRTTVFSSEPRSASGESLRAFSNSIRQIVEPIPAT